MRSGNPPWTCILRQGRCWWSSIGMSVGGFLHAEGFNERCSQLIPLLPHHNTLVGDKLTTIHHLIRVHLVPEPLHKAPHVLAEVELLVGIEASPKRQAQVFARHDVDRVLTRIVVGNHRRSAVEGSHRQDQVHLCIDSTQAPGPVAIGNYMPLLPLCNFLLCDFKYRLEPILRTVYYLSFHYMKFNISQWWAFKFRTFPQQLDFVSSPWAIQDPVGCLAKHLADAMQEWNGPRRPSEWSMEDKDQAILTGRLRQPGDGVYLWSPLPSKKQPRHILRIHSRDV